MFFFEAKPELSNNESYLGEVKPSLILSFPVAFMCLILTILIVSIMIYYFDYVHYYFYVMSGIYPDGNILKTLIITTTVIIMFIPLVIKVLTLKTTVYEFTTQRLYYTRGILTQKRDQLELSRIRDVATIKPFWLRVFGFGNVILDTADRSHPILIIPAQKKPDTMKDWIHYINKHERNRLGYREFENTAF